MSVRILVAGIGNIFFGDDGFGSEVARRLAREPVPDGVRVVDYGIGGLHLAYDIADGVDTLIIIDAVPMDGPSGGHSGTAIPGEVFILEADLDQLGTSTLDAHGMDPATVLTSVRNLGSEPPRTFVVGCHPHDLSEGIGLSDAVAGSVESARTAVLELVDRELTNKET